MSVLCYCKKCGRIVMKDPKEEWKCDYCRSALSPVPDEFLDEKCDIAFKSDEVEEQFINEYIKPSPEFDQYLFDHRDEDLAARSAQLMAIIRGGRDGSGGPCCPSCGSKNISGIGTVGRAVSVGLFGLASSKIGKTHKCNSCGSMW